MKKILGVILAMVVAVTGFAFAEGLNAETESGYVLVRFRALSGESYALIGSGSGADAFEAFASDEDTYAERYADFWKTLSLLEPAKTLNAAFADLKIGVSEDGKNSVVSLNGETIVGIDGLESFAIVYGSDEMPAVDEACTLNLWTKDSGAAGGTICPNCGRIDDGSDAHDEVISPFCAEEHTECMGNPEHHCDECGRDYVCSKSNSHATCAKCGQPWCDKSNGDHTQPECGHRECEISADEAAHAQCAACEGYLCDGEDHTLAACGIHHADAQGDHSQQECSHFACEITGENAAEHALCESCGAWLCDGGNHAHAGDGENDGGVIIVA